VKLTSFLVLPTAIFLFLLTGCNHSVANNKAVSHNPSPSPANIRAHSIVDINSAPKVDLEALPGIGEAYAQRIIDHRPYREKTDLVRLKIIPESTYEQIKDTIIAHQK